MKMGEERQKEILNTGCFRNKYRGTRVGGENVDLF